RSESRGSAGAGALLRAAHAPRRAPLQRRNPAGARRSHHSRRRFGDESRGENATAGAGDVVQPDAGRPPHRRVEAALTPRVDAAATAAPLSLINSSSGSPGSVRALLARKDGVLQLL